MSQLCGVGSTSGAGSGAENKDAKNLEMPIFLLLEHCRALRKLVTGSNLGSVPAAWGYWVVYVTEG